MSEDEIQRIADAVDPSEVITLTKELIRIDSVSGHEHRIAERVAAYLEVNGLSPRIVPVRDGRPNVMASWGTGRPALLFTGHIDTVPFGEGWTRDPLGGEEAGGRIYGRGASDMKSGLAAMMVALSTAGRELPSPGRAVSFAAVIDEEVSGLGTRAAIAEGIDAECAVLAEPTELQPICAAKGNCYFKIDVRGRAAHAGSPELGVNAIAAAAALARAVEDYNDSLMTRRHPLLGRPYATVTRIEGGTGESSVPDRCVFTIDRRLLPNETGRSSLADLQVYLRRHVPSEQTAPYEVTLKMELPAMEVAADHSIVRAIQQASIASGGPSLPVGGWTAACDGGLLSADARIPTVLFGPGSIVMEAHRPDESVAIDQLLIATRTYARVAARALLGEMQ